MSKFETGLISTAAGGFVSGLSRGLYGGLLGASTAVASTIIVNEMGGGEFASIVVPAVASFATGGGAAGLYGAGFGAALSETSNGNTGSVAVSSMLASGGANLFFGKIQRFGGPRTRGGLVVKGATFGFLGGITQELVEKTLNQEFGCENTGKSYKVDSCSFN